MKVRFNRGALADLDEIFSYIAADNHKAASEFVDHIEEVVRLIGHSPEMGVRTKRPQLRMFPVANYLIIYEVVADEVIIHYVRHGARKRPWEGEP